MSHVLYSLHRCLVRWYVLTFGFAALLTVGIVPGDASANSDDSGRWWVREVQPGPVGYFTSIALQPNGLPCISYYEGYPGFALRLATASRSGWSIEDVGPSSHYAAHSSLAVDQTTGRPWIAYGFYREGLYCAYRDSQQNWIVEAIDAAGQIPGSRCLALTSAETPHIAYHADDALWHAWRENSSWRTELIDDDGDAGYPCSIGLDSHDQPHIVYGDRQTDAIRYAWSENGVWHIETIASGQQVSDFVCLAMDSRDRPHITFSGVSSTTLTYGVRRPSTQEWVFSKVHQGQYLWHPVIALTRSDRPVIAYVRWVPEWVYKLGFARMVAPHVWDVEELQGQGSGASIAVGRYGLPQISYENDGAGGIYLAVRQQRP